VRTKAFPIAAVASLICLSTPGVALPQCAFDGPPKAKGMKASMIRAFAGCPYVSPAPPFPNSQTGTFIPSCAPPYALSHYSFDTKGACTFQVASKLQTPCADGSPADCMALRFKVKCTGILSPDDTLSNESGFVLSMSVRTTIDDEDNGDMTVLDFPITVDVPATVNGKMQVSADSETMPLPGGIASLPGCAQLEMLRATILDPGGNPFAVLGSGIRPKGL
jgi:hypothetical protein